MPPRIFPSSWALCAPQIHVRHGRLAQAHLSENPGKTLPLLSDITESWRGLLLSFAKTTTSQAGVPLAQIQPSILAPTHPAADRSEKSHPVSIFASIHREA